MNEYEKFREEEYEYYRFVEAQAENVRISDINIKIFETTSPFRWNKLFRYIEYQDDKSVNIETIPECKDFVIDFIKNYRGDLFSE